MVVRWCGNRARTRLHCAHERIPRPRNCTRRTPVEPFLSTRGGRKIGGCTPIGSTRQRQRRVCPLRENVEETTVGIRAESGVGQVGKPPERSYCVVFFSSDPSRCGPLFGCSTTLFVLKAVLEAASRPKNAIAQTGPVECLYPGGPICAVLASCRVNASASARRKAASSLA